MINKSQESHNKETKHKKVLIKNELGLHARPAALFVQLTSKFESEITVKKGKQKVNGKSIMGLMMLAAGPGTNLTIEACGSDADNALNEIEKLVLDNFGE